MEEVQRIHTKDGSPFRLIQGYASEESSEEDERDHPEDVTLTRFGSTAAVVISDSHQVVPKESGYGENSPQKFSSHGVVLKSSTVMKSSINQGVTRQDEKNAPGRTGFIYPSQKNDNNEGDSVGWKANSASVDRKPDPAKVAKKDDFPLEVDEFGRLARKGESDTDSDGEQYRKICGKRGRGQRRSRSPQENRWRQKSCSPRRDNRKRSQEIFIRGNNCWIHRSRNKSPSIRQSGAAFRLEKAQPPECFNYIRGRCFRGASCRFLHSDFVPNRSRQREFEDISQEPGNFNVLNDGSYSESSKQTKISLTGSDADKCNSGPGEEAKRAGMQSSQEHSLASMKSIRDGAMGDNIGWSLVTDDEPWSSCVTEQNSHETHAVRELQESNANSIEEAKRIQPAVQSSQPQKNDCLPIQSSPACKNLSLSEKTPEPDAGVVRASHHSQATSACNKTEEPQNVPHLPPEDRHLSYHAPVQSIQSTTTQDQRPDALAYMIHPPLSQSYSSPVGQPHPSHVPSNQPSIQSQLPKDFTSSGFSASSIPLSSHQLLSAPTGHPSLLHSNNPSAPLSTKHRENLIPPATSSDSHPSPKDMLASFRPLMTNDYYPHKVPLNSAWSNVTPLPPSHVHGLPPRPSLPAEGYSSQKQPHIVPPLHEHSVPSRVPPGEATFPQGPDHHQSFHSAQSSRHLPLIDEVKGRPSTVGQQQNQPLNREEHSSHPGAPQVSLDSQRDYHIGHHSFPPEDRGTFSGLGFTSSSSVPQVNIMLPQARPLFGDHAPPAVFSREEFINPVRNPVYSHYQAQRNENHPSSADFHSKVDPSFQSFPSVFQEKSLSPHLPDLSMPRISRPTHYNPFASTFEQPYPSLKIGSDVSMQERDTSYKTRYDLSSSSGHFPAGELGSRLTALGDSFAHTYRREMSAEVLPGVQKQFVRDPAAGDPYDPLSDSIEPSSNMFKMSDHVQEQNPVVNKLSSLHRVADVEENSRQNVGLAAMHKLDVDELGEVATDAEGGVVENGSPQPGYEKDWSPGFPIDAQNTAPGEIEIDQIQSPGKSKNKDSRSMKLFKVVLADFVKEVLKPSWRQGNMSKEAFKTIVKKTVDKVSGAMASHQIPKSQGKINQYIESSRKKLTKLVMGYVQKYVKTLRALRELGLLEVAHLREPNEEQGSTN
ncbi:hypothetical protein J5N97_024702 [Dioscorea zingiberensis]|uniref:C3H1-type domain-containing protein n=1 Tax=Dioscorea zingiberensis TaxID=325984 RepID=A0A9D5H970_9LILI|nr:hypothetical protein J5N97_024702 [Dioscorea zingiberensis]